VALSGDAHEVLVEVASEAVQRVKEILGNGAAARPALVVLPGDQTIVVHARRGAPRSAGARAQLGGLPAVRRI
jgi:hypothetical protein